MYCIVFACIVQYTPRYIQVIHTPILQDYAFFIPPPSPPFFWFGRVALLLRVLVRRDDGALVECDCAVMETLWDFCPGKTESWWPGPAPLWAAFL